MTLSPVPAPETAPARPFHVRPFPVLAFAGASRRPGCLYGSVSYGDAAGGAGPLSPLEARKMYV